LFKKNRIQTSQTEIKQHYHSHVRVLFKDFVIAKKTKQYKFVNVIN